MLQRCPSTAGAASLAILAAMAATRSNCADGWWSSPQSAAAAVTGVGAFLSCSAPSTCGSSAGHARVLGVLLVLPQLAAAQSFEPAKTSVVTRRKLGYVMDDSSIKTAVAAWLADATVAEATYGHISTWKTGEVTDMEELFHRASSFNEDIGAWNTSGVTTMEDMFGGAYAFDQPIGNWSVGAVANMNRVFEGASAFNQDIGHWPVDSVIDMKKMFSEASAFNQDLSDWRLDSVTDCVEINQCVGCTRQFFTKSFLGDDAAVLARSSGEEPASPRHRAGVASMAWRTTR